MMNFKKYVNTYSTNAPFYTPCNYHVFRKYKSGTMVENGLTTTVLPYMIMIKMLPKYRKPYALDVPKI